MLPLLAVDGTQRAAQRSCLVLAPHPDDETLGCGATIARKTAAGTDVWVAFASLGTDSHRSSFISPQQLGELRRHEALEACRRLGVPASRVSFLSEEDRIETAAAVVRRGIAQLLEQGQQELLVVSGADPHPDHRALNQIVVEMQQQGAIRCEILEYPIWLWTDERGGRRWLAQVRAQQSKLAFAVPLSVRTAGFLEQKRFALEAHVTQMTHYSPTEPWWTLATAAKGRFLDTAFRDCELFFRRQ